MRTLRTLLVGPVILALLIALGPPVVAQDEDALAPASATGTLEFLEPGEEAGTGDAAGAEVHDEATPHVHRWTSSDPRLSGMATYTGEWHIYDPPSEDCNDPEVTAGAVYEIVNDGGTWRCSGVRAPIPGPEGATNVHTMVLTGTGGYEGLYAYVMVDWSSSPFTFGALITPNMVPIVPVRPA